MDSRITFFDKNEKVIKMTIENRGTDLDESKDEIQCNVTTEDDITSFTLTQKKELHNEM